MSVQIETRTRLGVYVDDAQSSVSQTSAPHKSSSLSLASYSHTSCPHLLRRRPMAERQAAALVGRSGVISGDARDGLAFEVQYSRKHHSSASLHVCVPSQVTLDDFGNQGGYFSLTELVPAQPTTNSLQELPVPFSTAPPGQLAMAGALISKNHPLAATLTLTSLYSPLSTPTPTAILCPILPELFIITTHPKPLSFQSPSPFFCLQSLACSHRRPGRRQLAWDHLPRRSLVKWRPVLRERRRPCGGTPADLSGSGRVRHRLSGHPRYPNRSSASS